VYDLKEPFKDITIFKFQHSPFLLLLSEFTPRQGKGKVFPVQAVEALSLPHFQTFGS
jgi:hypothetical protein